VPERDDRFLELVGFGTVLGVVNDEILPAREVESQVARLGLRLGLHVRNHHPADVRRQVQPGERGPRVAVVLLQQKEDVQLVLGVVEPSDALDQASQRLRLVVERHEDRVERALVVAERRELRRSNRDLPPRNQRLVDQPQLPRTEHKVVDDERPVKGDEVAPPGETQPHHRSGERHEDHLLLAAGEYVEGREVRGSSQQLEEDLLVTLPVRLVRGRLL
jgi:hypothetical protein